MIKKYQVDLMEEVKVLIVSAVIITIFISFYVWNTFQREEKEERIPTITESRPNGTVVIKKFTERGVITETRG